MEKNNRGFTMIELIMVIVILSILAAVAIPRFIDFRSDARTATARGIAASISSAANILHAQYVLRNISYMLGTTEGINRNTAVLYNANISGGVGNTVSVRAVPGGLTVNGSSARITITVGGVGTYTMTLTMGSSLEGPRVRLNF